MNKTWLCYIYTHFVNAIPKIISIEDEVWGWKILAWMSQSNLTEILRISRIWSQQVRRTVKPHTTGQTLIGPYALHVSVTAHKMKTIPSASETASKQSLALLLFMSRSLSVFAGFWIYFFQIKEVCSMVIASTNQLPSIISKKAPLESRREGSWVE